MTWWEALIVYLVLSAAGAAATAWHVYIQGWGDATWNDGINHVGEPDDRWHERRRFARNLAAVFSCLFNPLTLFVGWRYGARIFQAGVKAGSPENHTRWNREHY